MKAADMTTEDVYRMYAEVPRDRRPDAYWLMTKADLETLKERLPSENRSARPRRWRN